MPDYFYEKIKLTPFTFSTSNVEDDEYYIEDIVPYSSNFIILSCTDFDNFEKSLRKVLTLPYCHPHGNIIIYYHKYEDNEIIAKIFFAVWYFRAPNVVIYQYDDEENVAIVSPFSPFVHEKTMFDYKFGCWTAKIIGLPVYKFDTSLICVEGCHNISVTSKLRAKNFGTCIGFNTYKIPYKDRYYIPKLNLFEDKGKDLHGFTLRAFTTEVKPFLIVVIANGTFILKAREGTIWNILKKRMNFEIDLSSSLDVIHKPLKFDTTIEQIFAMAHRKGELILAPIYQFDVIVVEIDYTFAFRESGVCVVSHKAGFETILFNFNTVQENYIIIAEFTALVIGIWTVFISYSYLDTKKFSADLVGKNLMNTIRITIPITLWRPPKRASFRIFLAVTIWCFFVISFSTQAAVISFFTAFKRGKEVETFDDVVERGYHVEGVASPDLVLPDTEERFRIINSRLVSITDMFACINKLNTDSKRFCLMDCSLSQYLQNNMINEKGEQYLHIAKDRIHSHYLNFVFTKHSVLSDPVSYYMMRFFEAGLIRKWEDYRYNVFKEEVVIKPLNLEDYHGIIIMYIFCVIITSSIFILEFLFGNFIRFKRYCGLKITRWNRVRLVRKIKRKEKKVQKVKFVNNYTQTTSGQANSVLSLRASAD